jgi:hypothetical protein
MYKRNLIFYNSVHIITRKPPTKSVPANKILQPSSSNITAIKLSTSIPVDVLSKVWVCSHSLAGIAGSIPARGCLSVGNAVCCQIKVSTTVRSLIQRILIECGVCVCVCVCLCVCH